jgi:AraC-like DNA-binding protein
MMTVSVRSIWPVLWRLRTLRLDVGAILSAARANPEVLEDADARIPHTVLLALWHQAARQSGDNALGIHVAEQLRPGAFDVLDYAIRASSTLGEGLERLTRYHRVLHDAAIVRLSVEGDRAWLTHALPPEATPLPRHVAEFVVAAWLIVSRQATGLDFTPLQVSFRHPPPLDLSEHQRLFRAPVRFSQSANGLAIRRTLLDAPLIRSDPGLCAVLERYVTELLTRIRIDSSVAQRVRHLLAASLPTTKSAETIARELHMSRRTLHRQLRFEGTSFSELLDDLRRDLAIRYLGEPSLAIAEVAFLLGFSEASTFHRAFKRWRGTTPADYRRLVL